MIFLDSIFLDSGTRPQGMFQIPIPVMTHVRREWLSVRARYRRYQAPCRSASFSSSGKGEFRTPPEAANAMRVVLDWIVHSAASSGPRCDFADHARSLSLAGAPPIEVIEVSMAPARVSPSPTSVVGTMDGGRRTSTLRRRVWHVRSSTLPLPYVITSALYRIRLIEN